MDLYQLKYFLSAARHLNFSRAAEDLHVSPSAVSRSIALLERSVGRALFTRSKRHVALTAAGEALKAQAQGIFDRVEEARLELSGADQAPAFLRVASRELITNYLLPQPLKAFQERYPATRFGLYALDPFSLAEALRKDQLDLGFGYTELSGEGLSCRRLGRLTSHIYASKAYRKPAPHGFIAPRGFNAPPGPSADGFPDQRLERRIQYEAEFLETHRRFVLQGLCVGVLPDLVMKDALAAGRVKILPGPPLSRDIFCYRRRDRAQPKAVESLVAALRANLARAKSLSVGG